ncbi:MAG: M14 family zinc carboxypeptidase [Planctomycetota bacterium]|nr:M14 family zinc carboxypeptidase [Planctomycetota bacterium]
MSWKLPPSRVASCLFAALLVPTVFGQSAPDSQAEPRVPILDHARLTRELERIARDSGGAATIIPLGVSRAGRRIDALRIARGEVGPGRPGILVVGALDGELAWTSSLVLDHARELLARAATDEATKQFLESTTLYLVPRANPDSAEHRTSVPRIEFAATGAGVDDDRDGRNGEDGPVDVNGDGVVGWMRVLDARGEWIEDPTDPRAMVKADRAKGQRGRWKLLREARDADGDEEVGEDAPSDVVVNQNFPQGWQEHEPAAGRFATEEPEARALADFLILHHDVALVLTYGKLDNLAEKPKVKEDGGRRSVNPSDGIPAADAELHAELGRRWAALGGSSGKSEGGDAGTFQAWAQAQRGLWTVNLAPWSVPLDQKAPETADAKPTDDSAGEKGAEKPAEKLAEDRAQTSGEKGVEKSAGKSPDAKKSDDAPKPSDDAKRLRWFDAHPEQQGFRPWTAFRHPELGDVELGGFAPYALVEPPAAKRAEIADSTLKFLVSLGGVLPRVRVAEAKAKDLGAGTWRIDVVVGNESLLPLQSALARRARAVRPARVDLELKDGATLVAGPHEELVSDLAGSGGRREIRWIVRAPSLGSIAVRIDTDSAGTARVTPEVKR